MARDARVRYAAARRQYVVLVGAVDVAGRRWHVYAVPLALPRTPFGSNIKVTPGMDELKSRRHAAGTVPDTP